MGSTRRGTGRPRSTRRLRFQGLEHLESRQLLASNLGAAMAPYIPGDLPVRNPATGQLRMIQVQSLIRGNDPDAPLYSNQGKIVSGKDRAGNEWTITVHGPGEVIVTDTTPNDGALADDIATIQIINSNIHTTYVTGETTASARTLTGGTVTFNRLVAAGGVNTIQLNGFDLSNTTNPAVEQNSGVFLPGGVRHLEFHNIIGLFDQSQNVAPITIQIGDATRPTSVKPSIYLDSIYNSAYDSSSDSIPSEPVTTPTVQFLVNGEIQNFSVVSVSQSPVSPNFITATQNGTQTQWSGYPKSGPAPAAYQFLFNVVGTTGRTSIQTLGINNLESRGAVTNLTAQKDGQPFSSSASGMRRLGRARFGGTADGLGLDVNGPIGNLTFDKGLGNPTGVYTASAETTPTEQNPETQTVLLPATNYGTPQGSTGYAASGFLAGVIRGRTIGSIRANPANFKSVGAQNPDFVSLRRIGYPNQLTLPGAAITNSAITTDGSIDHVNVTGSLLNSEIKTGFNYQAHLAGLQGTRGNPSRIGSYQQRGDLINSVISASYAPADGVYQVDTGQAGPGSIQGRVRGFAYNTGGRTALGNEGAGVFARDKSGVLPTAP